MLLFSLCFAICPYFIYESINDIFDNEWAHPQYLNGFGLNSTCNKLNEMKIKTMARISKWIYIRLYILSGYLDKVTREKLPKIHSRFCYSLMYDADDWWPCRNFRSIGCVCFLLLAFHFNRFVYPAMQMEWKLVRCQQPSSRSCLPNSLFVIVHIELIYSIKLVHKTDECQWARDTVADNIFLDDLQIETSEM